MNGHACGILRLDAGLDANLSVVGEFQGVSGEVHQHLLEAMLVTQEKIRHARIDARIEHDAGFRGARRERADHVGNRAPQIEDGRIEL